MLFDENKRKVFTNHFLPLYAQKLADEVLENANFYGVYHRDLNAFCKGYKKANDRTKQELKGKLTDFLCDELADLGESVAFIDPAQIIATTAQNGINFKKFN